MVQAGNLLLVNTKRMLETMNFLFTFLILAYELSQRHRRSSLKVKQAQEMTALRCSSLFSL